ncbi:uncharacterized protein LOC120997037 isoform X1 [Bufo bufo]|uniref:uncharacterized protein LOC120997037 isoform X1 n=1 Tax=Bufo bufo TaxID=8384 RepID=UPI001ABDB1FB|nr:uncharacterized protein LOC120997037 isoform X1 [Bufo bufo]
MARSGFSAFLLFLGLVVSYVNGNTDLCGNILNGNLSNAGLSDFNLTVSPAHLLSNTSYTVNVTGNGNFTVLLQAVNQSTPVGNWSQGTSCNGSALFTGYFGTNKLLQTTWTSPDNVKNVTIKAFIQNDTTTFLLQQSLIQDTSQTTIAPVTTTNSQNSTASVAATNSTASVAATNSTAPVAATNSTATTSRVVQTTSAGSIDQSSLISVALSMVLSLLLIPNKHRV